MPRFPPQGLPRRVPLLQRYYQGITTSCRPSCRASLPSLGSTSVALVVFAPWPPSAPPRPGVGNPVSPAGKSPRKRQGLPSSWRTSKLSVCPCSVDSGGTACARPLRRRSMALGISTAKAPTKGLSKLNSMAFGLAVYASQYGLPRPTQDSLPAAGQALPDGLSPARFQRKVSELLPTSHPPFPSFAWHNEIDRRKQAGFHSYVRSHRPGAPRDYRAKREIVRLPKLVEGSPIGQKSSGNCVSKLISSNKTPSTRRN